VRRAGVDNEKDGCDSEVPAAADDAPLGAGELPGGLDVVSVPDDELTSGIGGVPAEK